ncbi:hypothetical protein K6119_14670 [Paracrocinitomix mangrovi]|uniref:hypothetical protein n=1 Tax=Paracrocinitomix mangrovi TaxID=2862509 RepID=UPI001C8D7649|nr:hypothetical protein [Paracrocinitomix mangrovi]UKN00976.1 hypothetical protein K6119_14670 [Paracrocinitomix mangrovi]
MNKHSTFIFLFSFMLLACNKGKNNDDSCNGSSTRRDIKIGIDTAAHLIDTIPIVTTVDSIGSIDVPEADKESVRMEIEKRTFTITAKVHKLSKHRDGDWKVKLTDGNDKYVNCESPNMGCEYISNSIFYDKMEKVRLWIETNKDSLEGTTVTITGVAFIDIDHKYPRNAAENEIELHPILDIHYE